MTPNELHREWLAADQVRLRLSLPADLFWFRGHFDQQPILPGVAQLDWVMAYGRTLFGIAAPFCGLDQVKFQSPVRPMETIWLSLHWQADSGRLDFVYEVEEGGMTHPLSRGRVRFDHGDAR